jgi:uncharacterized membrane protein
VKIPARENVRRRIIGRQARHVEARDKGDLKTMNLVAVALMVLGVALLVFGLSRVLRRRTATGIAISLLGVGMAALPLLIGVYLGPSP